MKLVWCSFINPALPEGSRFLGVALVCVETVDQAPALCGLLEINPGGAILAQEIPPHITVPENVIGRLLRRDEAESLAEDITLQVQHHLDQIRAWEQITKSKAIQHEDSPCPGCGSNIDASRSVNRADATPNPGDFSVCGYCGTLLRFGPDLKVMTTSEEEIPDYLRQHLNDARAKILGRYS